MVTINRSETPVYRDGTSHVGAASQTSNIKFAFDLGADVNIFEGE